jgi:hypothetical protein
MDDDSRWLEQARARGLDGALRVALDVLAPFGPLGAQLIWVAQPALGLLGLGQAAAHLAGALEEPGGIETMRRRLDGDNEA